MSFFGSLVGAAPYFADVVERKRQRDRQAVMDKLAQDRQAKQDAAAQAMQTANIGHLNAETAKLQQPTPPKVPPIIFDQQGVPYIRHEDGSIERARIRGELPNIPQASVDSIPDVGLPRGDNTPTAAPQGTTPRFGPRNPYSQEAIDAAGKKAGAVAQAQAPFKPTPTDPTKVHAANRDYDITHPLPTRPGGMTGGMGSGGIGGVARTAAAITGMVQADDQMTPFEQSVHSGRVDYTGLDYFKGQMTKMYDAHGKIDQAIHSATFANLDKNNPALASYLRLAETWALEDSNLSGRPSDFRTKLDAFVSAIGPNANPAQIESIQRFRRTRLDELKKFQPAMEAIAGRIAGQGAPTNGRGGGRGGGGGTTNGPTGDVDLSKPDATQSGAPTGTHTVTINGKTYRVPN